MEKKTEIDGIYKVTEGILINKDNAALQAYKKRKRQANIINDLEKDVNTMKDDLKEIKELLRSLIK